MSHPWKNGRIPPLCAHGDRQPARWPAPSSAPGFAPVRFSPFQHDLYFGAFSLRGGQFSDAYTVDGWNTVSCSHTRPQPGITLRHAAQYQNGRSGQSGLPQFRPLTPAQLRWCARSRRCKRFGNGCSTRGSKHCPSTQGCIPHRPDILLNALHIINDRLQIYAKIRIA